MSYPDYASEKFGAGVLTLAEAPGRIKERLLDAYLSQVMRAHPPDAGLSAEITKRINDLDARMTRVSEPAPNGTIAATVDAMTEEEASELAREIVELSWAIDHERHGVR